MTKTIQTAIRQLLDTEQVHGGTRVTMLTVERPYGADVVKLTTYDSNHREPHPAYGIYTGPDLDEVIERAREDAAKSFNRIPDPDCCDCMAGWDPECGVRGCWGVPDGTTSALVVA